MIRIEQLVKRYGAVQALAGLSLEVTSGSVYGFLGPNGAGKTTTMRILSGLARPDAGRAWVGNREIGAGDQTIRRTIGVLPEEPAFYPWMTASEYLSDFVAPLFHIRARDARKLTTTLIEKVGLDNAANRRIAGFSRGMRQRLGLAQALLPNPPVLLLDEPVSALDPAGRKEVLELIESLRGQTTIFLSTHILADVERICDEVGIIAQGKLILQARRDTLLERYALPIVEIEAEPSADDWQSAARQLEMVTRVTSEGKITRLHVRDVVAAQKPLLALLAASTVTVRRFEIVHPSLEDIFLRLTDNHKTARIQESIL